MDYMVQVVMVMSVDEHVRRGRSDMRCGERHDGMGVGPLM